VIENTFRVCHLDDIVERGIDQSVVLAWFRIFDLKLEGVVGLGPAQPIDEEEGSRRRFRMAVIFVVICTFVELADLHASCFENGMGNVAHALMSNEVHEFKDNLRKEAFEREFVVAEGTTFEHILHPLLFGFDLLQNCAISCEVSLRRGRVAIIFKVLEERWDHLGVFDNGEWKMASVEGTSSEMVRVDWT
jgi:hypothetical protein